MTHTDDKKHRRNLFDVTKHRAIPQESVEEGAKAFRAVAHALLNGAKQPANPHPLPTLAEQESEVALYGGWELGRAEAMRHWEEANRKEPGGPQTHYMQALREAAAQHAATLEKPAPVTAAIHGYVQQSDARQALVNRAKLLEAQVLAYIDELKTGISNEMGDVAADLAAYQSTGYRRLSVEEQTARLAEFKARDAELNNALRWLSKGKSDIEVGFMEINRSTFRPQPVKLPE